MDIFTKFICWFIVTLVGMVFIIDLIENTFISSFIIALIVAVLGARSGDWT
jgi:hypothetical protein